VLAERVGSVSEWVRCRVLISALADICLRRYIEVEIGQSLDCELMFRQLSHFHLAKSVWVEQAGPCF